MTVGHEHRVTELPLSLIPFPHLKKQIILFQRELKLLFDLHEVEVSSLAFPYQPGCQSLIILFLWFLNLVS